MNHHEGLCHIVEDPILINAQAVLGVGEFTEALDAAFALLCGLVPEVDFECGLDGCTPPVRAMALTSGMPKGWATNWSGDSVRTITGKCIALASYVARQECSLLSLSSKSLAGRRDDRQATDS